MFKLTHPDHIGTLAVALLAFAGFSSNALAQCTTCNVNLPGSATPVAVLGGSRTANELTLPAVDGIAHFAITISQSPASSGLPAALPAGIYPAWCGGLPSQDAPRGTPGDYTLLPTDPMDPYPGMRNKVNYILNNKRGTIDDVQHALWLVIGKVTRQTLLDNGLTDALALYDDAGANGGSFVPGPGQITSISLIAPSGPSNYQDLIIELIACGWIGDRVWWDTPNDGSQTSSGVLKPGINGAVVTLFDVTNNRIFGTKVTEPSPASYAYLPYQDKGTDGWYLFTGLCPSNTYRVSVTTPSGTTATYPTGESKNPGGAQVTLPGTSPAGVANMDFGFSGTPPLVVTCPSSTARVSVPYGKYLNASGGGSTYSWTLSPVSNPRAGFSGNLPGGLTFVPDGAIYGSPTTAGKYLFNLTASTGDQSASKQCEIDVAPPQVSANCAPAGTAQVGVPYNSSIPASGGMPATDPTAHYNFSLIDNTTLPPELSLNPTTGAITGTVTQAFTAATPYPYTVRVSDASGTSLGTSVQSCSIQVIPAGLSLACPTVTSVIGGGNYSAPLQASGGAAPYTYSLAPNSPALPAGFSVNAANGVVSGTAPRQAGTFSFIGQVKDNLQATATTPLDSNGNSCTITVSAPVTASCAPLSAATLNQPYSSAVVVTGGGPNYTYQLTPVNPTQPGYHDLPAAAFNGGAIAWTPTAAGVYTYSLTVTDTASAASASAGVCTITVPMSLACPTGAPTALNPYTANLVASGGTAPLNFSIAATAPTLALPADLSVAAGTGAITWSAPKPGSVFFKATVTDGAGASAISGAQTCNLTVPAPPPLTATCPSSTAQANVPYTSALTANGGAGTYTYAISPLPTGMNLASNGAITWTPAAAQTATFTASVTDGLGTTASQSCPLTVNPAPSATCIAITVVRGFAMTPVTLTPSGGAGAPYRFSATGLPSGLSMDINGTISGTPDATAVSGTYTVAITDKDGHTGTSTCSVTVNPPPSATCVTIDAVLGVSITPVTMVGSGGAGGDYTFSANGLPDGLTMSSTGTISGKPTFGGAFPYTVTMKDKAGNTGTVNCSVTVAYPPITYGCAVINAVYNQPITPVTVVAGGGPGIYTYSATGLPDGLAMDGAGKISGTPKAGGTFNYTVTVTDDKGHSANFKCSATVTYPPITSSCPVITGAAVNSPISVTLAASGGSGTGYTFTATGLPPGVGISPTGTISGKPSASGKYEYTVTITDGANNVGTLNCSVTVVAPPLTLACPAASGLVGIAYSSPLVAGGGKPPYAYSILTGGLPAGLTLNPLSGLLSGTPTATGPSTFTAVAKDSQAPADSTQADCKITIGAVINPGPTVVSGDAATIGFWHNQNGQALINSMNGGPTSTALGSWLASTFPSLYGKLAGQPNSAVAAEFMTYFSVSGTKTDAQVMAVALAIYVTDLDLGGPAAKSYGFNVSASGTAAKGYNTGANGTAIGLSNNTSYSVFTLLAQANSLRSANGYSPAAFNALNTIFDGINTTGDIK